MIHVVNGPNLNLLGKRETEIYGKTTLADIQRQLEDLAFCNSAEISFFQSNHEGEILDYLQKLTARDQVILNPGGLGHTSVALRDCISAIDSTVIEVHLSNIFARETFRRKSLISPVCKGVISGFGSDVYKIALNWLLERV
ncbi:MAG: 3-dehydroquinate dehydratase [Clostridiales bacterium]|jgi:3-dehydroquinate dehydratase-2|nr:3-dehydroquinate dehydratase [Clostridiales bacterium]MDN5281481.1 3-dehydroquinate dehydratase [Candidatus Ozemobacter sp.]